MKLTKYKKWFTLNYDEFMAAYSSDDTEVEENVRYEKIVPVTRVTGPDGEFCFFSNGILRMIYISGDTLMENIWHEFQNSRDARAEEKIVRSRAGKKANQYLFASQGFAASITGDNVDFVEIYPPCSLEQYLDEVYNEPGPFIR